MTNARPLRLMVFCIEARSKNNASFVKSHSQNKNWQPDASLRATCDCETKSFRRHIRIVAIIVAFERQIGYAWRTKSAILHNSECYAASPAVILCAFTNIRTRGGCALLIF